MKRWVSSKILSIIMTIVIVLGMIPAMELSGLFFEVSAAYENTWINTGNQAIDIVEIAKTQLGYIEGSNNDNKYGVSFNHNNVSWCAYFVSWCARQANIPTSILKTSSVATPGPVGFDMDYYAGGDNGPLSMYVNWNSKYDGSRTNGKYKGNNYRPNPGDLFFTPGTTHVGLVWYKDGDYFYTLEGNSNDEGSDNGYGVVTNRRLISNYYYGVPNYENTETKTLKVSFNANGGSISSDNYKLKSNLIYNKNDSTKYYQEWEYDKTKENGLINRGTFGIYKTGYTFVGWGTKASGGTVFDDDDISLKPSDLCSDINNGSCTVTLYAQWKPNTLNVNYNANGASISSDTYKISSNVICNKSDSSKAIQSWTFNKSKSNGLTNYGTFGLYKLGYTFVGWGTNATGGTIYGQNDSSLVPTTLNSKIKDGDCSLTLYAQWVPNTLKVYYNANGASITSDTYKISSDLIYTKSDSAKYYQKWTYNNAKESGLKNTNTFGIYKTGYHFAGWGTKASGGSVFDQNDSTLTPFKLSAGIKDGSQNITLYAQWEPNTANVYYNTNGGTTDSEKYEVKSGLVYRKSNSEKYFDTWTYNLPNESGFTNASTLGIYRTGYTFAGWSTKASGGTILNQNDTSIVPTDFTSTINSKNCSVTMYAQWIPNQVTIHFQSAGELLCQSHTVTNNGKLVTNSAIERPNATQLNYEGNTYVVSGNKTETLVYDVDSYMVSVDDAGLLLNDHVGRGYIAYRDYDGKWRAYINGKLAWYSVEEINMAISVGTFDGYNIYSQTGAIKTTMPNGNIYFYAVWFCNHTHSYILNSIQDSSCTVNGAEIYVCSCGDSYQNIIEARGHDYVEKVTVPTCTSIGYTTYTCSSCSDSYVDKETTELEHSYVKTVVKNPTCVEDGIAEFVCSVCDDKYLESIDILYHKYINTSVEPTCTTNGYTQTMCEQCSELLIGDYIEPKGHNFQSEIVTPTCTEDGCTIYTCNDCGDIQTNDNIDALGHDIIIDEAVDSTCSKRGLTEGQHCSRCDDATIPQVERALNSHIDVNSNGLCDSCDKIINKDLVKGIYISIATPETRTISYMKSIKLYANAVNLREGYKIKWKVEGDGVEIKPSANGKTCTVTSTSTGNVVIKAYIVDPSGNIVTDEKGKQICDSEYFYSEANLWLRIVYFFKKLFGISVTTAQFYKGII